MELYDWYGDLDWEKEFEGWDEEDEEVEDYGDNEDEVED